MSAPTPDDQYADALSQALSTGKVVIEGAGVQAVVDFTGATPTAEHAGTAEKDTCHYCGWPLGDAFNSEDHACPRDNGARVLPPGSGDTEQGQS